MVFAVQCPNPKCKKYMLVEEHEQGKVVSCLLCKTAIKVGTVVQGTATKPSSSREK
jgi:hypothetical protein